MRLSVNAFASLVANAGRGAGLPDGVAFDLARAVVALESHDGGGAGLALSCVSCAASGQRCRVIESREDGACRTLVISDDGHESEPGPTPHCLLAALAARDFYLVDSEGNDHTRIVIESVCPVGVLAAAGLLLAEPSGTADRAVLEAPGVGRMEFGVADLEASARVDENAPCDLSGVCEIAVGPDTGTTRAATRPDSSGFVIDDDTFTALKRFADKCLVPATEQSRLRGAGAGVNDTD